MPRPDLISTQGLLFSSSPPLFQLRSDPAHSGAFLHTAEVSPGTQFQWLNLSQAWSQREIFYSQVQMQKTGKHKFTKGENVDIDIP